MTDQVPPEDGPLNELVLAVDYKRPLAAEELGELFSALARDYHQSTGRTLIVTRVQSGSLIAFLQDAIILVGPYLRDAVEVVKAVNAMTSFAKSIGDALDRVRHGGVKGLFGGGRKRNGLRSVEALLKIATDSGSEVTLKYTTADGDVMETRVTPVEAIRIREQAKSERSAIQALRYQTPLRELTSLRSWPSTLGTSKEISSLTESLAHAYQGRDSLTSHSDLRALISTLVLTVRSSGMGYMLEMLATNLAGRGLYELAEMVRTEVRRSSDETEPPLET